ncbi:ABATE domain-containing protein [Streptomyces sp. MST-110588]|uniref:CGNR zinc finger domain-containing protein n=1 Tax=Streptomyces sp. MST-110588 TaxID=2833628 RepID=UPI001F5D33EA|nr:ABATE domain-containing protein [Streptomyces sp. MST-110588]UNO41762.1 ABATE domain-containing protein [Streptomyces sp. MST-110588]
MAAPYDLRFDCGRICLDLVATTGGPHAERLVGPEQLTAWLVGAGVVPGGAPIAGVDTAWVARFRALRELLRRVLHDELTDRAADADLTLLNDTAAPAVPPVRAVRAEGGDLVRTLAGPADCAGLLAAVARDAIGLLTDAVARGQLRQCEGESCSLVYLDTSRGRRRRWCSSEVCGNRERVARHRRRATRRGTDTATTSVQGTVPAPSPAATPTGAPAAVR